MMSLHIRKALVISLGALGLLAAQLRADCDIYTITCIQKHVACLTATPLKFPAISFADVNFDDPLIEQCAHDIEQATSFKPLAQTWDYLKTHDVDEVVLGKFSLLLLLSYHTIFYHAMFSQVAPKNRVTFFSIIPLYYQLSKIPLHKLFDSLEECWNQYQEIMANYGPAEGETFSSWIQNYWWVPLTVSVFTMISFIQWYRAHGKIAHKG